MYNLIIFVEVSSQIPLVQHQVDDVKLINRKDSGARSEENEPLNIRLREDPKLSGYIKCTSREDCLKKAPNSH